VRLANDWGVPDWQQAEQYPSWPAGDGNAWSWEFLRRNRDYRELWTRVLPFVADDGSIGNDGDGCSAGFEDAGRFGLLLGPHDPRNPKAPLMAGANAVRVLRGSAARLERRITLGLSEVGYVFDLELPLEPQFARALGSAKELRQHRVNEEQIDPKPVRLQADNYVVYLRLIDAEDAGASRSKIEEILFRNISNEPPERRRSKTFDNARKAAHRLRDRDYRFIAVARNTK
jgi:hypothetical protein